MFERFTKAAVRAVHQAVFTAHDRGDPAISTEHLLAGVAASPSPAAELLTSMGASPAELRAAMSNLDATALASVGLSEEALRFEPELANGRGRSATFDSRMPPSRRSMRRYEKRLGSNTDISEQSTSCSPLHPRATRTQP